MEVVDTALLNCIELESEAKCRFFGLDHMYLLMSEIAKGYGDVCAVRALSMVVYMKLSLVGGVQCGMYVHVTLQHLYI